MKKQKVLKILNIFLILTFMITITALVLVKLIPTAGFLYEIHETAGLSFIIIGLCHLILNYNWIKSMYLKRK